MHEAVATRFEVSFNRDFSGSDNATLFKLLGEIFMCPMWWQPLDEQLQDFGLLSGVSLLQAKVLLIERQNAALDTSKLGILVCLDGLLCVVQLLELDEREIKVLEHRPKS